MSRGYRPTTEERERWEADRAPLRTAEELAGPLAAALWAIKEAFDGRAENLGYLREYASDVDARPGYERQAHECVETARRLERITSVLVTGMVDGAEPARVTTLVGAVATIMHVMTDGVRDLDSELNDRWYEFG